MPNDDLKLVIGKKNAQKNSTYQSPRLVPLGNLAELIRGGGTSNFDGTSQGETPAD